MFRLHHIDKSEWAVMNEEDEIVFSGTSLACEDWLDSQENLDRSRGARGLLRSLWSGIRALAGRRSAQRDDASAPPQKGVPERHKQPGATDVRSPKC